MLLAARILNEVADETLKAGIQVPEFYFLGSDLMYIFMVMNGLMHWNNQKYKSEERIRAEYPLIREQFQAGVFPPEVLEEGTDHPWETGNPSSHCAIIQPIGR